MTLNMSSRVTSIVTMFIVSNMTSDSENKVLAVIRKVGYARASDIKNKLKYVPERTIQRKLKDLVNQKKLEHIFPKDFKLYGFEGKGNETYYATPEYLSGKKHVKEMLDLLDTGTAKEKTEAIKELDGMEKYEYSSEELDLFYFIIKETKDEELLENAGRIIYNNLDKNNTPINIDKIIEAMNEKLNNKTVNTQMGTQFLRCMSIMNNPSAIKWLKYLIKNNFIDLSSEWENSSIYAKVVNAHATDLFKFGLTLEGNQKYVLNNIRSKAKKRMERGKK